LRAGATNLEADHAHGKDCTVCRRPVELRDQRVLIKSGTLHAYCSADCAHRHALAHEQPTLEGELRRRRLQRWARVARCLVIASPFILLTSGGKSEGSWRPPAVARPDEDAARAAERAAEQALLKEIAGDVWIHPLDGPVRRMPISDSRVFGAERPGERPAECRSGHCGVDIGGEIFGEPVHAAHDGVIDRVQRGPNEDHGGLYVRIAHRDGTLFTQYFHLAAIPRRIVVGLPVKAGEVVGLVGESGVKHSKAHLHFTLSVKPSPTGKEQYIDPESLIAIWPLRVPTAATSMVLRPEAAPGIPRGPGPWKKKPKLAARQHDHAALPHLPAAPAEHASDGEAD
jgi:murein DD-endopeptidase MepM/ murein hydrolase activator NlpD